VQRGMYSFVSLGQFIPPNISDLEVHSTPLLPPIVKPGDKVRIAVTVKNTGSATVNGPTLHFKHNSKLIDFSSDPMPDDYKNGEATYSLTSFAPFSSRTFLITITIPTDANESDRFACEIKTGSLFTALDAHQPDNYDTVTVKLQNKGKSAVVKAGMNGDKVDAKIRSLSYHVDFTNIGSSMVKRLVMLDTVDAKLPMLRVEITHFYPADIKIRTEKSNILVVEYPNANLSSFESNPAFSSGFMRYRIDLRSDLKPDDYIYNRATGDFDSRWSASSNLVTVLVANPSVSASRKSFQFGNVWPNPASGYLNIQFYAHTNGMVSLITTDGRVVKTIMVNGNTAEISLDDLPQGLYMITTPSGSGRIQISR